MIRNLFLILIAAILLWGGESREAPFPEKLEMEGASLIRNGTGVREKFFLDLYRAGLYLPERSNDAEKIVRTHTPQAIRIVILSSLIGSKSMKEGIEKGFKKSMNGDTTPLKEEIERFIQAFDAKIKRGDCFTLLYRPGSGVEIYKNGAKIDTIEGENFKEALFGIWLGKNPVQKDLKKQMLGG